MISVNFENLKIVYLSDMEQNFVAKNAHPIKDNFITRWQAPSNIALIKYWGKTTPQLPKNASLSFTLTHAVTQTQVEFKPLENPTEKVTFSIIFEGEEKSSFRPKLEDFFPIYCRISLFWHITN